MKPILPWISALTANPSARSEKSESGGNSCRFFLDEIAVLGYTVCSKN
jgi:hypothetical protein